MRKGVCIALLLMLVAAQPFASKAEEPGKAPAPKAKQEELSNLAKLELSSEEVKRYIAALPSFMAEFKAGAKSPNATPEKLDTFVREKGYRNFNEFVTANAAILAACQMINAHKSRLALEKEINTLPADKQKEFAPQIQALSAQFEMLKKKVSTKTLLSVNENLPALEAVIEKLSLSNGAK